MRYRLLLSVAALVTMLSLLGNDAFAAGALAIDENQGDQYGFSYGLPTREEANDRALSECGSGCSIVYEFENGCAAYAADQTSGSSVYGWGTADDGGSAQNEALSQCSSHGGTQCMVRSWGCNGE